MTHGPMRDINPKSTLPVLFGIIAIPIFILYIYHNPVRWDALFYYLFPRNEINFLCAAVIWLAGYGAGHPIVQWLQYKEHTLPAWLIKIAIGWGVLAYLMFAFALLQCLNVYAISAVVILLALYGWMQCHGIWAWIKNQPCNLYHSWVSTGWTLRVIWLMIGVTVFYAVVSSLMPPTQSDGLRYHLTVPKLYLDAGGFYLIPNLSFSNFPFLIEYLYVIPLSIGLISIPKLIHCSYFLLTLVLLFHTGKKFGGREGGWIAVLLISATPFVPIFASWSFIEFGLTFYTVLAFVICCDACEQSNETVWKQFVLIGLIAGLAVSCKYTALASAAAVAGLYALTFLSHKKTITHSIIGSAVIFATALIAASPWFIKNYLLLGNPVYPFAGSVFPTPGWSEFNAEFFAYHAGMKGAMNVFKTAPLSWQLWDILTLPFYATFFPGENHHQPHNFGAWPLGAAWLAMLPLLLIHKKWSVRYASHIGFAIFLYLLWALTYRDTRFMLPCIAVLSPVCAWVLWTAIKEAVWTKVVIGLVLLYNICFTTGLMFIPESYAPWWVVSGLTPREYYLLNESRDTRWRNHSFRYLKQNAEPDDIVLFHGVDHGFYCPNPYIGADWFNTDPLIALSWEVDSVEELIAKLKEQEIKYIIYDYGTIAKYNTPGQPFYRFFCLPTQQSLPLLREWIANETNRIHYPAVHKLWYPGYMQRLETTYQTAPNVLILQKLLNGNTLETVYEFDMDEADPLEGIRVLQLPE